MTLLTVKSLTKKFGQTHAVKNVNFSLARGQCIALIGPNGAGKTTIIRLLTKLLKPTSGKISFKEPGTDMRKFIGYLPQYPVFPNWMTAKEFLIFSGELGLLDNELATERALMLAKRVGIEEALNKRIGGFSGGMKQRLGIAQAMIHKPELLILDEPVSSLDPIGRREILTLMEELKSETTILFSTHILNDAEEVSDTLLFIRQGELIESGTMTELQKKYQTAMIELKIDSRLDDYLEQIKKLPHVTDGYIDGDQIKILVTSIPEARTEILQRAAHENWPITAFQTHRMTLEELFMKLVMT